MIALYVILSLLALVLLLLIFVLFSPLSVRIVYRDGVKVYAGLSFIRIKLLPSKEKKHKEKKKTKEKKPPKNDKKKVSEKLKEKHREAQDDQDNKKSSLKDTLSLIFDIVKSVFEMMGKKAKIKIDVLKVVVSKPDAADTAIQFGICNGIVMTLLAFTSNFGKSVIKDENVSVSPDFLSGKSKIEADITLSARTISILISLIKGYLNNQSKKSSTERADKNDK